MVRSISLSEQDSVRKKSAGPQLGSQGYPRKVKLHRMARFISVRYESALNQGSRTQWWCLFHSQNNTLINRTILCHLTFLGYPRDPSWGPADFFSDTVLFWEWNKHHHCIRLPWFSGLSYLTLENWAIPLKVTFLGYPWDPSQVLPTFFGHCNVLRVK